MMNVNINNKMSFPQLKLQKDLLYIAENIIIKTLKFNIDKEQSLTEVRYDPLAKSTLKIKRQQGLSPMILHATGKLRNSFLSIASGKSQVKVTLNSTRLDIGDILQNKGVRSKAHGGKRYFNFFGISTRMEDLAMKYMRKRIDEEIKK